MSSPHETDTKVSALETQPMYPGASSQRESAAMYANARSSQQNDLNKSHGGYKKKRKHKGGSSSGTMVVPSFDNLI